MAIIVDWYDETQHIIIKKHIDTWTLDDITVSNAELIQTAKQTLDRFDIITDFSQATQYAPPIGLLWQWYEADTELETLFPNWGLNIYIASSSVGQAYFEAGFEQYEVIRTHSRQVQTLEESLRLIMADRAQAD